MKDDILEFLAAVTLVLVSAAALRVIVTGSMWNAENVNIDSVGTFVHKQYAPPSIKPVPQR